MSAAPSRRTNEPELHLRGGRPHPLRLSKESHKIGKQKAAPPPPAAGVRSHHHPPPPPVIIYTVSPKVFHVEPEDFMSVVQRLTGSNFSSLSAVDSSPPPPPPPPSSFGGVSAPELPEWRETEFSAGGVEMGRNIGWNGSDSNPMSYLHGNRNVNNMNMPSSSSSSTTLDVLDYFPHI